MATRCYIGIVNPLLSVDFVYCHWDGYPDYTGRMLIDNYNDHDKAATLLRRGDISSLAATADDTQYIFDDDVVRYPMSFKSITLFKDYLKDTSHIEYAYLYDRDQWTAYNNAGDRIDLSYLQSHNDR